MWLARSPLKSQELFGDRSRQLGFAGTYNIDHETGLTELESGTYVFMDTEYVIVGGKDGDMRRYNDWKAALTVMTTVDSQHHPNIITTDYGNKAVRHRTARRLRPSTSSSTRDTQQPLATSGCAPPSAKWVLRTYPTVETSRLAAGRMFWLMRKKLSGSYFALTAASRS